MTLPLRPAARPGFQTKARCPDLPSGPRSGKAGLLARFGACLVSRLLPLMALALLAATNALAQSTPAVTRLPGAGKAGTAPAVLPAAVAGEAPGPGAAAPPTRQASPRAAADDAPPRELGEFERLARDANGGKALWRPGTPQRAGDPGLPAQDAPARVPPHYVVQVGDEVTVSVWGSLDGQWVLRVDRAGRLTLPRVGPVAVAGATAGALEGLLRTRVGQVFKGFELAAAVTELSPLQVHITGFVERPGNYVVPGLTTISGALALAQGPSAAGSWRRVRLLREDRPVTDFDLYALLGSGSRRDDRLLQPGDVLFVDAVGPQVAVMGSVNRAAVLEFLPGETVADALRWAGGLSSVADRELLTLERLRDRHSLGAVTLSMPRDGVTELQDGDILRARSRVAGVVPTQLRNKRVQVDGEVRRPGEYLLPAQATLADAVAAAGGATPSAFVFGTALRRESVRITQEANYERALRELESDYARGSSNRPSGEDQQAHADQAVGQLLGRLRSRRPEGRMVLELAPDTSTLPAIELEDGDQIHLPALNQSVGVFGSVYNAGSFVHAAGRDIGSYIQRAGGPREGAHAAGAFVVRANGGVLSATQGEGWSRLRQFEAQPALPGDTVFVPEELFRVGWVQGAKDWTQILYQLGVGLAALMTIK